MPSHTLLRRALSAVLALGLAACRGPSNAPDAELVAYIDGIKAIDAHAHPLHYVAPGAPVDSDFDALPLDGLGGFNVPLGLRPEHPSYRAAQHALFGMSETDTSKAYAKALETARSAVMQKEGEGYPVWALDHAGIDVMLSNRIVMGAGLPAQRFQWIPFADPLMLPLDVRDEAKRTPDVKSLYPLEAKLLARYLRDLNLSKIPSTLEAYEHDVVAATLERQKKAGAVGIKFEAAYLRPLNFDPADAQTARMTYARYAGGGIPTHAEYIQLENYLFRVIAKHAGRLDLTIQIHATEIAGGFYDLAGSSPMLLESAFNDSTLRKTNFVITHGGWPRVQETMMLLSKPNVYADISMMNLIAEPAALASTLRTWLGEYPEKVMFGTDAFDGGAPQGWEQIAWIASHNTRAALAVALTGMMRDGEITRDRAKKIARMVLRENAVTAYHF